MFVFDVDGDWVDLVELEHCAVGDEMRLRAIIDGRNQPSRTTAVLHIDRVPTPARAMSSVALVTRSEGMRDPVVPEPVSVVDVRVLFRYFLELTLRHRPSQGLHEVYYRLQHVADMDPAAEPGLGSTRQPPRPAP